MSEAIFLYSFDECITKKSPFVTNSDNDFVVIYPVKKEDLFYYEKTLVFSYLSAAKRIVQSVYSKNYGNKSPDTGDDCIALPVLHLYFHVLEISLKIFVRRLDHHAKKCNRISGYPDGLNKILEDHNLQPLIDAVELMLSKNDGLHAFNEFGKIANFIKKFEEFGIHSFSTRYNMTRKGKIYSLHDDQLYLNLMKMEKNIVIIVNSVNYYIDGAHFYYCECGDFSSDKINELRLVAEIMESENDLFVTFKHNYNFYPDTQDKRGFIVWDEETLKNQEKKNRLASNLTERIISFDQNKLAALAMGFCFSNGPDSSSLSLFREIQEEENIGTIIRKALSYKEALNELYAHIGYLEKYLL